LYLTGRATQLTLRQLAEELDIKCPANITMTIKRYEKRLAQNKEERKMTAAAAQMLDVDVAL
jgi:hypothetical protein